ncbi:MAG: formate/nitrite transporter family protein [Paludibacteraceae bacterium]|nr:formate/nitrite transporter family protein [Paludibacteraceae bacterium]
MKTLDIFRSAVFAGVCIGVAGFGFLVNPNIGMFLFIFGLATVVQYKLKLFTGTAGWVENKKDFADLMIILSGNIVGCLLVALLARCSDMDLTSAAENILNRRISNGWWQCGLLSIGCGFLMTTAVNFARKSKEFGDWVPLLLAVPLFIHCGFPHCIADTFYYMTCSPHAVFSQPTFPLLYISIIAGNFIGCNLYKIFLRKEYRV